MLTATYTLVALSVEQASVRVSVETFQNYVRLNLMHQQSMTLGQLEFACDTLSRLYRDCHWRKIDMYLIPAIRQATERADRLLDELSSMNAAALDIIHTIRASIDSMAAQSEKHVAQICSSIDDFCSTLLKRLEKEEQELFAIARSVIFGDAWFSIANQFMLHDARLEETRRAKAPVIALALPFSPINPASAELPDADMTHRAIDLPSKVTARK